VKACVSGEHRETRGRYSVGHETRVEVYRTVETRTAAGQHGVGTGWFTKHRSGSMFQSVRWRG
jgi:hypothetical protein